MIELRAPVVGFIHTSLPGAQAVSANPRVFHSQIFRDDRGICLCGKVLENAYKAALFWAKVNIGVTSALVVFGVKTIPENTFAGTMRFTDTRSESISYSVWYRCGVARCLKKRISAKAHRRDSFIGVGFEVSGALTNLTPVERLGRNVLAWL